MPQQNIKKLKFLHRSESLVVVGVLSLFRPLYLWWNRSSLSNPTFFCLDLRHLYTLPVASGPHPGPTSTNHSTSFLSVSFIFSFHFYPFQTQILMHSLILSQLLLMRLLCLVMLDQFEGPWFSTLKSQLSINYQQSHLVKNWFMTGILKWTTAFWFFLPNTACV